MSPFRPSKIFLLSLVGRESMKIFLLSLPNRESKKIGGIGMTLQVLVVDYFHNSILWPFTTILHRMCFPRDGPRWGQGPSMEKK